MCVPGRVDPRNAIRLVLVTVSAALVASPARAEPSRQTAADDVTLDYRVPPGCPGEDAFRAELRTRSPPLRAETAAATALSVHVTQVGRTVVGDLTMRVGDALTGTRQLQGDTCREVVVGLALSAAMDLAAIPPAAVAPRTQASREAGPEVNPAASTTHATWQLAVGLQGGVTSGVADAVLWGVPVFVEVRARSHETLSPSARASFEITGSAPVAEVVGEVQFLWYVASLDGCPVRLGTASLAVRACARVELGALRASPRGVPFGHHDATQPWVAADLVLRAAWEGPGPFFFELEAGGRAPLVRPEFVFLPQTTVYRVPWASALAGVGAGVRFF